MRVMWDTLDTVCILYMYLYVCFSMTETMRTQGEMDVLETLYRKGEKLLGYLGHSGFDYARDTSDIWNMF